MNDDNNFSPNYNKNVVTAADHARFLLSLVESTERNAVYSCRWGLPAGFNPLIHLSHTTLKHSRRIGKFPRLNEIWQQLDSLAQKWEELQRELTAADLLAERSREGSTRTHTLPQPYKAQIDADIAALNPLALAEELKDVIRRK